MKKYLLVGGPLDGQYHEGQPFREHIEVLDNMADYLDPKKNVDPLEILEVKRTFYRPFTMKVGDSIHEFLMDEAIPEQDAIPKLIYGYRQDDKAQAEIKKLERKIVSLESRNKYLEGDVEFWQSQHDAMVEGQS